MSKADFIDSVAEKAELTRAAAARAVEAIFDTATGAISEAVHAAGSFSLPGFGKFTKKTRAARTGRNPRTGAVINIPERASVSFSAGKGLKTGASTSRRKKTAEGGSATTKRSARTGAARQTGTTARAATKRTAADGARKSAPAKRTGAAKTAGSTTARGGSTAKKGGGRSR